MLVSDFNYSLPEELIAQQPPAVRGASRMMTLDRRTGAYTDRLFTDLPSLLQPGDLLILNDSRVLPARLFATRAGLHTQHNSPAPTGHIEVLLTEHLPNPEGHNDWRALVKPAKKIQPGETLHFHAAPTTDAALKGTGFSPSGGSSGLQPTESVQHEAGALAPEGPALTATILATGDFGERTLRFAPVADFYAILDRIGHLPLPPYIHRDKQQPNTPEDRNRYQTVYSKPFAQPDEQHLKGTGFSPSVNGQKERGALAPEGLAGSAAAPTAGLHFTPEILKALQQRGIELAYLTLHVGLGTFQPIRVDRTEDIRLHAEPYTLPAATAEAINKAVRDHRRIIAVGTTSTRTLEHIARESERTGQPITAHSGSTSLFLSPGLNDQFKLVGGLLTNFHLPQSTLLMLVSAFAGREATLHAYAHAVAARYHFFSYGDCMLIT
ncbi:tRNA preQ1(34) S-adenosylmethionine ribosyltransferase-isomerase QueA [Granulicella sp. 5B5]|uniref:S-adenosylmethionine:tRNA ribosyltransferase-isomerase n=1 Tax=Granulicella sp. 5B5 TaxID=1617967 RepID=UPI0015F3FE52|nr:S-adenosylmethionine:tRNA ribosyltransferase-isomerase [Granulicella sp. 5B5]QMV19212.1 tRNA preQ1(34) S-adenosylmethionine ribosyltransferase-isomerase QueA [Granulicella sp. 5B5]